VTALEAVAFIVALFIGGPFMCCLLAKAGGARAATTQSELSTRAEDGK